MRKLLAHYVFDGSQYHKLAVLILDEQNNIVGIEEKSEPFVEHAGVEFYNGVICYDKEKKNDVVLLEKFDYQHFRKTEQTTERSLL